MVWPWLRLSVCQDICQILIRWQSLVGIGLRQPAASSVRPLERKRPLTLADDTLWYIHERKKSSFTNWIAKFAFGFGYIRLAQCIGLYTVCSVLFKATFSDCYGKVVLLVTVYIGKLKPIWCMLMDFLSRLSLLLVESRCRIGEARRSCSIVSFTTYPTKSKHCYYHPKI